jgi:hypothetical protein
MSIFEALFTITVYTVVAFTSVGIPLMAQVALSILKPAGSVGATVHQVVRLPVVQQLLHYQLQYSSQLVV